MALYGLQAGVVKEHLTVLNNKSRQTPTIPGRILIKYVDTCFCQSSKGVITVIKRWTHLITLLIIKNLSHLNMGTPSPVVRFLGGPLKDSLSDKILTIKISQYPFNKDFLISLILDCLL